MLPVKLTSPCTANLPKQNIHSTYRVEFSWTLYTVEKSIEYLRKFQCSFELCPRKEIAEATGVDKCNIELSMESMGNYPGVMNEEGTEITIWGWTNTVEVMKWLSPEEVERVKREKEHKDTPR